ncbi:unnamed protein product [Somion occarium]|uniref:Maturase K n=1 Tax=Somion occarium TaxID=3059160 RepID=A0ABP1CPR9_9APHY
MQDAHFPLYREAEVQIWRDNFRIWMSFSQRLSRQECRLSEDRYPENRRRGCLSFVDVLKHSRFDYHPSDEFVLPLSLPQFSNVKQPLSSRASYIRTSQRVTSIPGTKGISSPFILPSSLFPPHRHVLVFAYDYPFILFIVTVVFNCLSRCLSRPSRWHALHWRLVILFPPSCAHVTFICTIELIDALFVDCPFERKKAGGKRNWIRGRGITDVTYSINVQYITPSP